MSKIKQKIKFYDPNIDRKNKIYNDALKLLRGRAIPSIIEITTPAYVTGNVHFVRSDPGYKHVNEFFSNKLHDKLCDDLASYSFSGILLIVDLTNHC